jgi:hypothetical protein
MKLKRQIANLTGVELRRNVVKLDGESNSKLFEELYSRIVFRLLELMREFIQGNNEFVRTRLNRQFYQEITLQLGNAKYGDDETVNKYRFFLIDTLDTLQQAILNYIHCTNKEVLLEQYKKKAEILDDNEKLMEYLESKKRRMTIFTDKSVTVPMATLKPQFAEYIKRYGVPDGLRFDAVKMREIVVELISLGVLTANELN